MPTNKSPLIALQPVSSSKIHSIGYDAATQRMAVRFKDREGNPTTLYHYDQVGADDFAAFRDAKSIGSHFIKTFQRASDRFPYTRIDESADEG